MRRGVTSIFFVNKRSQWLFKIASIAIKTHTSDVRGGHLMFSSTAGVVPDFFPISNRVQFIVIRPGFKLTKDNTKQNRLQ